MKPDTALFSLATRIINHTGKHLFLTGRAGTGKTTFLRQIQETTPKKAVVVAPTGVAALNAGGVTMHSFFQLPLGMYLPDASPFAGDEWNEQLVVNRHSLFKNIRFNQDKRELLREMELLIIDEVSMLRADALDAIDAILRSFRHKQALPFGGVQVLFIGDLFQLPPVLRQNEAALFYEHYSSPFFFSANVTREDPPLVVELKHIFRQSEERFIGVLNAIRNNTADEELLSVLHARYKPGQEPEEGSVLLTTHNARADQTNARMLARLPGKEHCFEAIFERDFNDHALPAERALCLKAGAQIMFIKNDPARRYYNGKLARIEHIGAEGDIWVVPEGSREPMKLELHTWKNIRYKYNREEDRLEEQELGAFRQYPIRLAWAITIHKSQGLTFDRATVDAGSSFAAGQVYVALSRLRSLEGLVLHSRIPERGIEMPEQILDFYRQQLDEAQLEILVRREEEFFAQQRLVEWFSLEKFQDAWRHFHEAYSGRRIAALEEARVWSAGCLNHLSEMKATADRFQKQLDGLLGPRRDYAAIRARVDAAAAWMSRGLQQQVLQPLQQHARDWKVKARSKKYLTELQALEAAGLHCLKEWQQAQQLAAGLAQGTAASEIRFELKPIAPMQLPEAASGKPKKGDSMALSLALYQEGKSIPEIAAARGLVNSTIERHLLHYLSSGEVSLDAFVNPEQQCRIEAVLAQMGNSATATELHQALGEAYSYTMIRAVQLHVHPEQQPQAE